LCTQVVLTQSQLATAEHWLPANEHGSPAFFEEHAAWSGAMMSAQAGDGVARIAKTRTPFRHFMGRPS
jgi:hypothetical protein